MTTKEINQHLASYVSDLVEKGGLSGDATNRAFLLGGVLAEWLLEHGWDRTQPGFWTHRHYKGFCVVTDTREVVVMQENVVSGELEVVEAMPHNIL